MYGTKSDPVACDPQETSEFSSQNLVMKRFLSSSDWAIEHGILDCANKTDFKPQQQITKHESNSQNTVRKGKGNGRYLAVVSCTLGPPYTARFIILALGCISKHNKKMHMSFFCLPLSLAALPIVFPLPVFPINSSVSSAFPICGDPAASFLSWITGCVLLGPYVQVFVTYKSFLALHSAGDSVLILLHPAAVKQILGGRRISRNAALVFHVLLWLSD